MPTTSISWTIARKTESRLVRLLHDAVRRVALQPVSAPIQCVKIESDLGLGPSHVSGLIHSKGQHAFRHLCPVLSRPDTTRMLRCIHPTSEHKPPDFGDTRPDMGTQQCTQTLSQSVDGDVAQLAEQRVYTPWRQISGRLWVRFPPSPLCP